MKQSELRKHATCSLCRKPILASGLPLFWRVTVERFGVDIQAMKRQDGLGAFIGNHAIAAVMGPDEEMAKPIGNPTVLTFCETCGTDSDLSVAALAEMRP